MIIVLQHTLKSRIEMPPALAFFFNIPLAIWGLFLFYTNFRVVCSSSLKNSCDVLVRIALNAWIAMGSIAVSTIFVLPINEDGMFLNFFVSQFLS